MLDLINITLFIYRILNAFIEINIFLIFLYQRQELERKAEEEKLR